MTWPANDKAKGEEIDEEHINNIVDSLRPWQNSSTAGWCPWIENGKVNFFIKGTKADATCKCITWKRMDAYGTVEWNAKVTGLPEANVLAYLGSFESVCAPGYHDHIFVWIDGTTYKFTTSDGTAEETTELSGQDWTNDTKFKVVWDAAAVKLYVDDVLEATHTTRIPTTAMLKLAEIKHSSYAGSTDHYLEIDEEFFQ